MTTTTEQTTLANPPIVLEAPAPVPAVKADDADEMVQLDNGKVPELDEKVSTFVDAVLSHNVHSQTFQDKVSALHHLGNAEIRAAAAVSNRMLERPANAMNVGLMADSPIAKSLIDLRATIEELDPTEQDLLAPRKLLGFIPFGNRARDYFRGYQSSQTHLNDIIERLYKGRDELIKDNAALEQEKVNLWQLMQLLRQYIYVGKQIDEKLSDKIAQIATNDSEKARVVKEEMLFYVRQKRVDFLTQLTVSIQGYLTLDMIRKNNLELIKGVDRATTTTVSALRTAVMAAQALTNQKLVLDQINALNQTTGDLIESTSKMLRQQTGDIHQQAAGSTIEVEKLKQAFNNIYATMDAISDFKVKALDHMQQTVDTLSTEVEKSQDYLQRARGEGVASVAAELDNKDAAAFTQSEVNLS